MKVKLYAYTLAINHLEKECDKLRKRIDKLSTEMLTMLDGNLSMRQRANKRATHATLCESLAGKESDIEELRKLVKEEKR